MSEGDEFKRAMCLWLETSMHRSMHDFIQYHRTVGLSMSQINSLFRIYHLGPASVNDLAEHLGVTKAAVSQLLDRLVEDGLILRREDPRDRRSKQILLTDKGTRTVLKSMRSRHGWVDELAQRLTPDEKAMILPALHSLLAAMNGGLASSMFECNP